LAAVAKKGDISVAIVGEGELQSQRSEGSPRITLRGQQGNRNSQLSTCRIGKREEREDACPSEWEPVRDSATIGGGGKWRFEVLRRIP